MLVTGSIINPRIFISTSLHASHKTFGRPIVPLYHHFSNKTVGKSSRYPHVYITASRRLDQSPGRKIHRLVLAAPANDLSAGFIASFNHYFNSLSDMPFIINPLDLPLSLLQNAQATG